MHPTGELRVSTRVLREAAAAVIADDLVAGLAGLSRDTLADWPSGHAATAAVEAAIAGAAGLAESIAEMATALRAVADAYDGADERALGRQPRARWAGPQEW
jgi:hypothetical protein